MLRLGIVQHGPVRLRGIGYARFGGLDVKLAHLHRKLAAFVRVLDPQHLVLLG